MPKPLVRVSSDVQLYTVRRSERCLSCTVRLKESKEVVLAVVYKHLEYRTVGQRGESQLVEVSREAPLASLQKLLSLNVILRRKACSCLCAAIVRGTQLIQRPDFKLYTASSRTEERACTSVSEALESVREAKYSSVLPSTSYIYQMTSHATV